MIEIDYLGRSGNQAIQYMFARLIGHHNNQYVETPAPKGLIDFKEDQLIDKKKHPTDFYLHDITASLNGFRFLIRPEYRLHNVHLKGYFQWPGWYDDGKAEIKSWMNLPEIGDEHENDLAIHLRMEDYFLLSYPVIIEPSWYERALEHVDGKRIFVITTPIMIPEEKRYLDMVLNMALKKKRPVEVVFGGIENFWLIRQFGNIICSNGTFCWLASWLSYADKIVSFKPWRLAETKGFVSIEGREITRDQI